jgi:hypothetical protein
MRHVPEEALPCGDARDGSLFRPGPSDPVVSSGTAEADVVVAVVGVVLVAVSSTHVARVVVPGPAADDTVRAGFPTIVPILTGHGDGSPPRSMKTRAMTGSLTPPSPAHLMRRAGEGEEERLRRVFTVTGHGREVENRPAFDLCFAKRPPTSGNHNGCSAARHDGGAVRTTTGEKPVGVNDNKHV